MGRSYFLVGEIWGKLGKVVKIDQNGLNDRENVQPIPAEPI